MVMSIRGDWACRDECPMPDNRLSVLSSPIEFAHHHSTTSRSTMIATGFSTRWLSSCARFIVPGSVSVQPAEQKRASHMSTKTAKPILRREDVIPDFTLRDAAGTPVSSRSFYMRRNIVVVFVPEGGIESWHDWAERLAEAMMTVPVSDAQAFVITPNEGTLSRIHEITKSAENITALVDPDGRISERFGYGGEQGLLLVTDRFGTVFHAASGDPEAADLDPARVPEWIEFIACQC
jgi:peroxiredoxin